MTDGARLREHARRWRVGIERLDRSPASLLAFGTRDDRAVVLKMTREVREGEVLAAFAGHGVVRVLEYDEEAVLLEHIQPGTSLRSVVVAGDDDRATAILAEVIARMKLVAMPKTVPTARAWGEALIRRLPPGVHPGSAALVERARQIYGHLCDSQRSPRLLHGDLHHDNVLLDMDRGWLAIDPKGVVAEAEFEVGAALRNPCDMPQVFANPETILRRVGSCTRALSLDPRRVLAWAFAQAVLAAIWVIEDGGTVAPDHPWLTFARHLEPMLSM